MSRKKKNGNGNGNGKQSEVEEVKKVRTVKDTSSFALKKNIVITARTENQKKLLKSIRDNIVTIVHGPAGSGKTRLAVLQGLRGLISGKYKKLLFTRPCVEANGENLGFLPGDLNEKIRPYMLPIFDFLSEFMDQKQIQYCLDENKIMTLPLAFQRGITFDKSYVVLDEAQNTNISQVRMFLTRIGDSGCKIVMTGDPEQTDIQGVNGLSDAITRLEDVEGLNVVGFGSEDVQRHPIVIDIEKKYLDE